MIHNAPLPPKGLRNLGNSCYINAVLQGLAHCDLIHTSVKESFHYSRCPLRQDCVRCSFERCVTDLRRPVATLAINNPVARIIRILPHISINGALMTSGRQEDAHEFLSNLLVSAQECPSASGSPESAKSQAAPRCNLGLRSLFQGRLSSSVYCGECKSLSTTREAVQGLELEVGRAAALTTALDEYCGAESLTAASGNAYDCSVCRTHTTAQKALRLVDVPPVLRIQLKRFRYGSGRCEKLTHHVEYPEVLDMSPYVLSKQAEEGEENAPALANAHLPGTPEPLKSCIEGASDGLIKSIDDATLLYRLSAVIVHQGGSPESGHYTAIVRCGSWWYLTNDDSVTRVTLQDALSQQAYVLLYERVSLLDSHTRADLSRSEPLSPLRGVAWSSPVPTSAVRAPGRLVSHSSAYYTNSSAPVASFAAPSSKERECDDEAGYFSSSSRAGANPLLSGAKVAVSDVYATDGDLGTRDVSASRASNSYLVEVKQRAAAASATAPSQVPAPPPSASTHKNLHSRPGAQQPPTAVPSRRVYSGFSRRRLFTSINIFAFSSSGKGRREVNVRNLSVLGQQQRQSQQKEQDDQKTRGEQGNTTPGSRRARVDGFLFPAQQQRWDDSNSNTPVAWTSKGDTETETGNPEVEQDEVDEHERTGVDSGTKRRRLNVSDGTSGKGHLHYVRSEEAPQIIADETRDRTRKKASSWVAFIPEKIRALFSGN